MTAFGPEPHGPGTDSNLLPPFFLIRALLDIGKPAGGGGSGKARERMACDERGEEGEQAQELGIWKVRRSPRPQVSIRIAEVTVWILLGRLREEIFDFS